jgi:hypothetical protein
MSLFIFIQQSHRQHYLACGQPRGVTLYHNSNVLRTSFIFSGTQDGSILGDYVRKKNDLHRLLMLPKSDQKAARATNVSPRSGPTNPELCL